MMSIKLRRSDMVAVGSNFKLHMHCILGFSSMSCVCSLHLSGSKDRVVSDLMGGFKHPAATGWC